ncbi:hypothetical protein AO072_14450 [Pseudomonas syringae ICMP 13102]|nr:hypothetical protein AO072_14450 [Pseudomonas syringae ICMP 13102]
MLGVINPAMLIHSTAGVAAQRMFRRISHRVAVRMVEQPRLDHYGLVGGSMPALPGVVFFTKSRALPVGHSNASSDTAMSRLGIIGLHRIT